MLTLQTFDESDAAAWDDLVARSVNGTFLHTRRFLSYHGDRFVDRSLLVRRESGKLAAVLPAADAAADGERSVATHPGITYGGLVHDGALKGDEVLAALAAIADHYRAEGFTRLVYKAVPPIYHAVPASDDVYALWRLGAERYRCDLSATIDLRRPRRVSHGRRTGLKLATAAGARVSTEWASVTPFWDVLTGAVARHGATPVHGLEEIELLHSRFPANISLVSASLGGDVVAGTVLFAAGPVLHTQYIGADERGRETSALDLVLDHAIAAAEAAGFSYFDFGISTTDQGRTLNESLHRFKTSFGAGATLYEHFDLRIA